MSSLARCRLPVLISTRSDELAEIEAIGHRMPGTCPLFNYLTADSRKSPIQGAEERQGLGIHCPSFATAVISPTAYPVCMGKMVHLDIGPDDIQPHWLTERETYQKFSCPFAYLGAAVTHGQVRVEVALTANNPFGELEVLPHTP